jgi:glycosyltransferase involved in cell wall biosynthesis
VYLIDITRLLGRLLKRRLPTGVDRVGIEYLRYYQGRSQLVVRFRGSFFALSKAASVRLSSQLIAPNGFCSLVGILVRDLWCWRRPPSGAWLINTGHSGLEHKEYPQWIAAYHMRPIYFIHDLIPISHPQFSRALEPEKHKIRIFNALTTAAGIVTNSTDTLNHLTHYAEQNRQPMPKACVALLAPAKLPVGAPISPMPRPYFLILGTIEGRKNHELLLAIWRSLPKDGPMLVIVGRRGWSCESVINDLDNDPQLVGKVLELSHCTDEQLATWLKHARALLFPSHVEGYGMPLVEALCAGVPVIASDLPVFREIAGNIPEYLNPLNTEAWKARIIDYSKKDSKYRLEQCQRLENYSEPTWERHFSTVEGFIKTLI